MDSETPSEVFSESDSRSLRIPSDELIPNPSIISEQPLGISDRRMSQANLLSSISQNSSIITKPFQSVSSMSNMNSVTLDPLTELCVQVIVQHFKDFSFIFRDAKLPMKYLNSIASHMSVDLDLSVAAEGLVGPHCEKYWKRRCAIYPSITSVSKHRDSWKVAFFEERVRLELENFSKSMEVDDLKKSLSIAKDYVYTLHIKQFLSHTDFNNVISYLPKLEHLDLSYGAQNLGTDFEFNLFGIHKSDCNSLSTALKKSKLHVLQLSNNLMDTEKLNLLLTGIKYIPTLHTLDLSHNKINDDGVKGLTAVLQQEKCQIQHLDLSNNQIGSSGAKSLAGILSKKPKLVSLNLRLNQIGNGAKLLIDSLLQNDMLQTLNLSSNFIDGESISGLDAVLTKNSVLNELDLSCNFDIKDEAVTFLKSLSQNASLTSLSLKRCGVSAEILENIKKTLKAKIPAE